MIVTCPNCTTRLQLDDAKVPARAFSVRCPKCQQIINAQPPAPQAQRDALAAVAGGVPATTRAQAEAGAAPAAPVLRAPEPGEGQGAPGGEGEVVRLLTALLQRGAAEAAGPRGAARRPSWERRRALVCMGSAHCEAVADALVENYYEVCVVAEAAQAVEQMREVPADVLVLDEQFDTAAQGAAAVARELNSMRMADRRRVVFVQLSDKARTGDAHAAFLSNANLIVNTGDLDNLIRVLDKNIRDLNELYRDFNKASGVPEL
ncbi:MAG TPA: zinc-ribbon domain-containing protein [Pyrinomonadaceae bacterium]|nr:zinc-ribbon domain-containing protein [Pyrinomonadaceae bacterium]